MRVPVGKPVLALFSAACIAVPVTTTTALAAPLAESSVEIGAAAAPAVVDPNAVLELLTFPYHNAYGISLGIGTAANAGFQAVLLPLSIAGFVATNKTDQIPAYTQTVQTNLANAIPNVIKAIQAEIDYDRNLFSQFGFGSPSGANALARAATPAEAISVLAAADPGTALLQLLTFPYHNFYGISLGLGNAANSVLQLALLPLSIVSLVAVNKADQIPAYIQTVQTNLANAIPNVIKAVQAEIEYNQNLFSQFGASSDTSVNAVARVASSDTAGALATAAPAAIDSNTILQLLTFPYHNIYGISLGLGNAANSVLQLALLPLSIGSFIAVNKTDQIPAYIQTVQTNLANAIPNVIKAVQAEIDYNQNLFSQFGLAVSPQASMSTLAASTSPAKIQAVPTAVESAATVATVDHTTVDPTVAKSDGGTDTTNPSAGTTGTVPAGATETTPETNPDTSITDDDATGTEATGTTENTGTETTGTTETAGTDPEEKPDTQDTTTGTGIDATNTGSTPTKKAEAPDAEDGAAAGDTTTDSGESAK